MKSFNDENLIGKKYGRLTVIEDMGKRNNVRYWKCVCDCAERTEVIVRCYALRSGNTKSCGCMHKEQLAKRNHNNHKWNIENDRIYRIWKAMKHRCYNENDTHYKNYGGIGITICEEWFNNFETFQDWAVTNGYADNLTIDRIDGRKNYCPENCRWITQKEQCNNISRNKILEYNGEQHTLAEWCEKLGLNYGRTKARLNNCRWSVKDAFEREKYSQVNANKKQKFNKNNIGTGQSQSLILKGK